MWKVSKEEKEKEGETDQQALLLSIPYLGAMSAAAAKEEGEKDKKPA